MLKCQVICQCINSLHRVKDNIAELNNERLLFKHEECPSGGRQCNSFINIYIYKERERTHRLYIGAPQMHNLAYPPAKNTLGCCLNHCATSSCTSLYDINTWPLKAPTNPAPCPYFRVMWIPCWGYYDTYWLTGVLVYPSQGGKYRAEGCKALR